MRDCESGDIRALELPQGKINVASRQYFGQNVASHKIAYE
jgi:hypothetical protein